MKDKPWLKFYDKEVPQSLAPYREYTLVDVFLDNARERPDQPAYLFQGASISQRQADQLITSFAYALRSMGVQIGDRVAMLMPNTVQLIIALLGTWKAGGIAVPLNPLYTPHELEHVFNESEAETVVVLTPFYQNVKSIQPRTTIRRVIATNVKEYLPAAKRLLFTLFKEKKEGHRVRLQPGDFWMQALLREHKYEADYLPRPAPSDPAILLFSGGTTGVPKAAMSTHHKLYISGVQFFTWGKSQGLGWDTPGLTLMPMFHTYGISAQFASGLVGHIPGIIIPNPRDLDDLLDNIHKYKPATLLGVPTLFNALVSHPRVVSKQVDLSSLRVCNSGAASLLAETRDRFINVTGAKLTEGYGMTETNSVATSTPLTSGYRPNSCGIPLPDVDIKIVDIETGEVELKPGEIGEIVIRGPALMSGYWNRPEETEEILRDGWLYSGDIGYMDEDGFLFIVDRKKDLIKPSGFQVWPREVEEVIAAHPAVAEVCVVGVPDAHSVEAVKAWVVLNKGHNLTEQELQSFCREKLTGYKVPKHVVFTNSLPKSAVGKLLRRELAAKEET